MSVCVNFRTKKQFEPKMLFDELVKRGKKIMVTSAEFPCLKLGTHLEALRGVEINKEDNGYEIRVCSFANRADLQLYGAVVEMMVSLTGENPLYEDNEEEVISDPKEFFGDKWIKSQRESSLSVMCALIKYNGKPIIMDGIFFPFCFGPILARDFDIDLSDPYIEDLNVIQDYLSGLQWKYADKESTSSRLALQNPNEEERPLPKIDPDLEDVDKIGLYIDSFFKGHICKVLGIKNRFFNIYENVMKKYTVSSPQYDEEEDSEAIFDKVFGSSTDG